MKAVGKPLAGKTGTTNEAKDVWFVGFSPDLAVGVFIGYDKPRSLGDSATGGQISAPIFKDFMQMALKDKPPTPFRVPAGGTQGICKIFATAPSRAGWCPSKREVKKGGKPCRVTENNLAKGGKR